MNSIETLLTRLIEHRVDFVLVGGFAAVAHGSTLLTQDEEVKKHSIEIELPVGACRVLDLEALIRSKEAMNRPRDKEAVLQLKAIRRHLEK